MSFNETGFRPFYHQVCALELNDTLKEIIKDCPDADKSSHAVVYGYIDPEKGLMLEVLGGGKQATQYFYFKAPYEGSRITLSISEVADVPFLWFEKLKPDNYEKYAPRIEELKQYDVSEDLEKSREFDFLDGCREPSFPDDVRVVFLKQGLKQEECWVRLTGLGDHVLIGRLLNQPFQNFGVNEGDTISFYVHKESDDKIICVADFTDQEILMDVGKMDIFNYALYQNHVAPVKGIRILNQTGDPAEGLTLQISSDSDIFEQYAASLPPIPSGKPVDIDNPTLTINGRTLAQLTETVTVNITVELRKDGKIICGCHGQMQVLAYDQWQGGESYQDLLPAFVLPNHPVIPALLHDASDRLRKWRKPTSLEGYQQNDPNRVRDLAAAAYAAIQKKNIIYAEPPASFSIPGQRIRTPEMVMEQGLGTCMDMTLLYAATLEAIGLHPLLVMMEGHIFAGVWLRERSVDELKSGDVVIDNLALLQNRINTGSDEMTFVECTSMCSGKQVSFEEAEKAAKSALFVYADEFRFAIDVFLSRRRGVKPIPSRMKDSGEYKIQIKELKESNITAAPKNLGISIVQPLKSRPKKITGKKELWESKLLDLSQYNMLLSLPLNASVMPVMSSHIDELEDALADGHEFHVLPAAEWIAGLEFTTVDEKGKESKPIPWLKEAIKKYGVFELNHWPVGKEFDFNEKFRQEFRNHRLYTFSGDKQLNRELTTIYRAARSSQQENGVSSLYLAIGLMRWFPDPEEKKPGYAPLILLPIEIIRKSANQGYALHARDEEPHFNMTLLEMLKQNYNLDIPGLDPLPTDEHGIDIKKVFAIVKGALFTLQGWDVVESCVIGNFSFAQFAMWNDIHTVGDLLNNSKVVRSLIKGHVDWDISVPDNLDEEEIYLPITVDATQLKAIKMAAYGSTFVLHGPPGTGKSQTITGMISNLMAQGKKVLFVAEKMAALSVVQRRLASLGIGDFCLELHSNKANKKQVLSQLEKALAVKNPSHRTEYEELLKNAAAGRAKLDSYAKHLHKVQKSGYSLRELVDLYETVRNEERMIRFDPYSVGQLSHEQIRRHLPLLGQLTAAGEVVGNIRNHPLTGVGLTSYGADVRSAMRRDSMQYRDALNHLETASKRVTELLNIKKTEGRDDYSYLNQVIQLFFDRKEDESVFLDVLEDRKEELESWFRENESILEEEQILKSKWKEEFLSQDIAAYQAKHESAGKKFFGKNAAINAVVSELQGFARETLTYNNIPAKLQEILTYQERKQYLENLYQSLSEDTKKLLDKFATKQDYKKALDTAQAFRVQAEIFPGGLTAIRTLSSNTEAADRFADYQTQYHKVLEAERKFNELLIRSTHSETKDWISEEKGFCGYLLDHPASLKDWGLYNQIRQECIKVGLKPAVKAFESSLEPDKLELAYQKGFYYALITEIISTDDILSSFSGVTFNESIRQFKRMDELMLQQTKSEIYYLLASRVPSSWDSPEVGKELNLLRKAIGSNARGMSIRTLFERIPHVLQALCPCMLMSPDSVAQYLAQKNDLFDVVIFDEASQLPTCKAIGALSRAKDAVIVGDPKQMPPTSFFAGSGPNVEDLAMDDLDSILDDALALGIPSQHLQWHYRSTHESLIAFSNNRFYNNKMYTFPSANDRERHVIAVHVEGLYKNSTNIKEAEAVVEEIVRRYRDPKLKGQSIGVVTFNVKQQTLIENLLAKQFQSDPGLDAWANTGEDPLFVKNLENVQGDERDVILFSIGYGPDERGHVSNNFGPINRNGGGKRLNVAFSRSRVTMMIFSSIYSNDIRVTESSPEGVVAFRDFLKYAEGHDLNPESVESIAARDTKTGILQSIRNSITDHGFQCVPMVGHSDFHVDIAVVDPYEPTKYLMGILLDGEGYRKTTNTRDREVAQIGVLKNLGWTLHRIWTIDWWDNRDKELKKLMTLLEKLKAESRKKHEKDTKIEEAEAAEKIKQTEEAMALKEELAQQAAEVIADDQDAEREEKEIHVVVDNSTAAAEEITPEETVLSDSEATTEQSITEQNIPAVEEEAAKSPENNLPDTEEEGVQAVDEMTGHDNPVSDPVTALFVQLREAGAEFVDKRKNGGALWIIGGKELKAVMQSFKEIGVKFTFKAGGGKATKGKDGWWAKTDIVIPDISAPVSKVETKNADEYSEPKVDNGKESETLIENTTETEEIFSEPVSESTTIIPVPYVYADIPEEKLSADEYTAAGKRAEIVRRALDIVQVEGPILRESLIRKIMISYGVNKSKAVLEATEKALKAARIKTTRQKGIKVCWAAEQDPKAYFGLRVSNERSGEDICPQELSNAVVYALQTKGDLSKDDLIKEASIVLGYKRLGKKLETAITAGVQYAKSSKAIIYVPGGKFTLP